MSKLMKYIAISMLSVFVLIGCSSNDKEAQVGKKESATKENFKYTNYLDNIDTDNVEVIKTSSFASIDISNVAELRDFHENVFIGTVDSIDGASASVDDVYAMAPHTYGNISVLKNLKGNLDLGVVKFARYGGTISIADYEKGAPQEMITNDDLHRKAAGQENIDKENTYLTFMEEGDITLEAGKTYVFFGTVTDGGTFLIDGYEYGTRELSQPSTGKKAFRSMPAEDSLEIINNETGEYENLNAFIDKYFTEQ